jgi:hypothetical protein
MRKLKLNLDTFCSILGLITPLFLAAQDPFRVRASRDVRRDIERERLQTTRPAHGVIHQFPSGHLIPPLALLAFAVLPSFSAIRLIISRYFWSLDFPHDIQK